MGLLRWIFSLSVLSIWCGLIGTAVFVAMHRPSVDPVAGDVIVVLGGDISETGGLNPQTAERVGAAVALFEADAAPLVVMTGANGVAEAMRDAALDAGVPAQAIVLETAAMSTLQNALFTADLEAVSTDAPILLVTQKYHLARAHASFRWAGFRDVTNVAANPDDGLQLSRALLWEAVKWPYNILRAGAASAAKAGDVPRENYITYLQ